MAYIYISTPEYIAAETPLNCKMGEESTSEGAFLTLSGSNHFPEASEYWEMLTSFLSPPHELTVHSPS